MPGHYSERRWQPLPPPARPRTAPPPAHRPAPARRPKPALSKSGLPTTVLSINSARPPTATRWCNQTQGCTAGTTLGSGDGGAINPIGLVAGGRRRRLAFPATGPPPRWGRSYVEPTARLKSPPAKPATAARFRKETTTLDQDNPRSRTSGRLEERQRPPARLSAAARGIRPKPSPPATMRKNEPC